MFTFLLVLLIIDSLVLVAAILLQAGKGGGIAASFGGATSSTDALIGTRQAGNLLTKASWWGGGVFLLLSFVLQLMSTRTRVPSSVLDRPLTQPSAPVIPSTSQPPAGVPLTPKGSAEAAEKGSAQPKTPQPKQ